VEAYDEDAKVTIDYLATLETCNGRIGVTGTRTLTAIDLGMCLGGHLALRAAFDPRVLAAVSFFGTDIHSSTLGKGKHSDSLSRVHEIRGELIMIFGKKVRAAFSYLMVGSTCPCRGEGFDSQDVT
jgi:carboxymethylenebutenolidase